MAVRLSFCTAAGSISLHEIDPTLPTSLFFFFNDTATTEIYTLSLHDALPIFRFSSKAERADSGPPFFCIHSCEKTDRKSTRLNSSHGYISYAVFCLKKKNGCLSPGAL